MRFRRFTAALFIATSAVTSSRAHAAVIDTTWLGGTGSWNDPTKWSGGVVPNNGGSDSFNAVVPSGSVSMPSSAISVDGLNLQASALMTGTSAFNVSGVATIDGRMSIGSSAVGSLAGSGTVSVINSLVGSAGLDIPVGMRIEFGSQATIGRPTQPFINRGYVAGGVSAGTISLEFAPAHCRTWGRSRRAADTTPLATQHSLKRISVI